jgi:hypothetical protein
MIVHLKSRIGVFLVKAVFVLPLFVFGLWLIQALYFPEWRSAKREGLLQTDGGDDFFRKIGLQKAPVPRDHFHMIDAFIFQPGPYEPICRTCHGTYAHSKEKRIRSFLNSHEGFLACAVCHVRKEPADKSISFTWVDRQTGVAGMAVEGKYGKFPAQIFPKRIFASGQEEIIRPMSEKSAQAFLEHREKLTPDQVAQAKAKLHEHISKKPVVCLECHKSGGYLDFAELGFAKNRVDHLTSSEVASMIEKYETFYLPEVLDLGTQ